MQGLPLLLWECPAHSGTGLTCLESSPEGWTSQADSLRAEATSLVTPEETQHSQQDKLEVLLGPAQLSSGSSITSVKPGYNKEML